MFCLNLMRIALELAKENQAYEALATKFFQHYIYVGAAMKKMGGRDYQLWDEEDGFFYDVLRYPGRQLREVPRALARGPDPALRRRAPRGALDRALPRVQGEPALVPAEQAPRRPGRLPPVHRRDGSACYVCAIVDEDQMRRLLRPRPRSRGVPLALRPAQPLAVPRRRTRSASATARCATSPARPSRRSRAATRTGGARSGSRPRS